MFLTSLLQNKNTSYFTVQHASLLAAVAAETAGITTNALQPLAPISTLSEEVRRHTAQVAAATTEAQQVVVAAGVHPSLGMLERRLSQFHKHCLEITFLTLTLNDS